MPWWPWTWGGERSVDSGEGGKAGCRYHDDGFVCDEGLRIDDEGGDGELDGW